MSSLLLQIYKYVYKKYLTESKIETVSTYLLADTTHKNVRQVQGTVTKLNSSESYGLINNYIYFKHDVIAGNVTLSVGDSVSVLASRKEKHCAWQAEIVTLCINEWDSGTNTSVDVVVSNTIDSEHKKEDTYLKYIHADDLVVAEVNDGFGRTKCNLLFYFNDSKINFKPVVGDSITALVAVLGQKKKITEWEPSEVHIINGVITMRDVTFGVINEDIVFFFSACKINMPIMINQKVSAKVVKYEYGVFKWRAFQFFLCENDEQLNIVQKNCLIDIKGLFITNTVDFKQVLIGEECTQTVTLKNEGIEPLNFLGCKLKKLENDKSPFSVVKCNSDILVLNPGSEVNITVNCKTSCLGYEEDVLLFEFEAFFISRKITVCAVDPAHNILNPTHPYSPKLINHNLFDERFKVLIPGERPYKKRSAFSKKLPGYPVPKNLWDVVTYGDENELLKMFPYLSFDLEESSYVKKFQLLLHLEEIQLCFDIREYDMCEVFLVRKGEFLSLEVPGLAEGRPSLLIGDSAILCYPGSACNSSAYEGYIYEVQQNSIILKFNQYFHDKYDGESFDVSFRFNRTSFRRLHHSIKLVASQAKLLFPYNTGLKKKLVYFENSYLRSSKVFKKYCKIIVWHNKNLNSQQKKAVQYILEARCRPLPYIVFGPPGTGKTITLVEAIIQVLKNFRNARILICTPSNSAADLITQRLLESEIIDKSDMVRLNSYQRNVDSIPEFIKPICKDKDELGEINKYRIVATTCSTAGSLYTADLPADHFTHIFIDEAGQLTEPECMTAVGLLCQHENGQIIMAGDHMQLGPVIRSTIAKKYGLELSYMERLMKFSVLYMRNEYKFKTSGGYDPLFVTMLNKCYRSHQSIMKFFSEMFYFSKIECGFIDENKNLSSWMGFPIIFHAIKGIEYREENSPSWFNPMEVVQTIEYLKKLYSLEIPSDEIGIITPYRKQVEKIRCLITAVQLQPCKIGSVEEFQGQERRVIIVSTVRSCNELLNYDMKHNLGFIHNAKRFNVTVSRAKELLIVIGNPQILRKDPHWNLFINYCSFNNSCRGCSTDDLEKNND